MRVPRVDADIHPDTQVLSLTVSLDNTNTILDMEGQKWSMFSSLVPRVTPQEAEDHGMTTEPPWGVLLTNGREELYLYESVQKPFLSLRSVDGSSGVLIELSVDAATTIHAAITAALDDTHRFHQTTAKHACIRPKGIYYHYDAQRVDVQVCGS